MGNNGSSDRFTPSDEIPGLAVMILMSDEAETEHGFAENEGRAEGTLAFPEGRRPRIKALAIMATSLKTGPARSRIGVRILGY